MLIQVRYTDPRSFVSKRALYKSSHKGSGIRPARSSGQRPMLFQPDPRPNRLRYTARVHRPPDIKGCWIRDQS